MGDAPTPPPVPPPSPPPTEPPHVGPHLRHAHNANGTAHHDCSLSSLMVVPSSSASLVLSAEGHHHACGSRPIVELAWQQPAGTAWQTVAQVGKHGEPLPFEIGGAHCPAPDGCRVAIRTRDGHWHNASAIGSSSSPDIVFTPPHLIAPPHFPGHRVDFFVRPPLPAPFDTAAKGCIDAMLTQLHDHYFVLRSNRIKLGEVSTTGAFVQLDLIPEDIYVYLSGPDVPRILLRLALRADELNLTNHFLEPRYGLWRQATPHEDKAIHKALPLKKLWPHVDDPINNPNADERAASGAGSHLLNTILHGSPRDTGNLEGLPHGRRPPPPEPPPVPPRPLPPPGSPGWSSPSLSPLPPPPPPSPPARRHQSIGAILKAPREGLVKWVSSKVPKSAPPSPASSLAPPSPAPPPSSSSSSLEHLLAGVGALVVFGGILWLAYWLYTKLHWSRFSVRARSGHAPLRSTDDDDFTSPCVRPNHRYYDGATRSNGSSYANGCHSNGFSPPSGASSGRGFLDNPWADAMPPSARSASARASFGSFSRGRYRADF